MFLDTFLFILGGVCASLAVAFAVYLLVSHKRGKAYRAVLKDETELFDALTTTALFTKTAQSTQTGARSGATTELMSGGDGTQLADGTLTEVTDFDASALEGRYILKSEIHGGGMSRVFLAESAKLGNRWIVKFISGKTGGLANEEKILKLLNHISLPKIIDIFYDSNGVYLVESFIEGVSLDKVLSTGQKLNQLLVLDWAEQLTQVLNYLHRLEPHPIYHFDLKPSNIMVTHDNKLVLIDFGISKRYGEDDTAAVGVTYSYAAPEQIKRRVPDKYMTLIESRFGQLPEARMSWNPDARTDIYSLGVILFELATGQKPTINNTGLLDGAVSGELSAIIKKCMAIEPDKRYQTVAELQAGLQKNKGSKVKMARTLLARRLAAVSTAFSVVVSGGSLTGGYYIYGQENLSLLDVDPEFVTVSLQQSAALKVEKQTPDGETVILDNSRIQWLSSADNIARLDGNRVTGINVGTTEITGKYRNKDITLSVKVVEPPEGLTEISQHYRLGRIVEIFAGTSERERIDGALSSADFVSPESIAVADDGSVYIADSGVLRIIKDGVVGSVVIEPDFLTPNLVRCHGNDVYMLTNAWQDDTGYYYAIIRGTNGAYEALYVADAQYSAVEDFCFLPGGLLCYIDRNAGVGAVYLRTIDPYNPDDIKLLCELPDGTSALTCDENGTIYLANPETGAIMMYADGELSYFAGIENERAFIDGAAPMFYAPQRIEYREGSLYIWDFNVLRRLEVDGGVAGGCETVAGGASPVFDLEIPYSSQAAEDIILPNSKLMGFAVTDGGILITDPKRGVIWHLT